MKIYPSIFKLYPEVITIRQDVAYDANNNVVHYDVAAVQAHANSQLYISQRALNTHQSPTTLMVL